MLLILENEMPPKLHAAAGMLGLALIGTFWISTVAVEILGTETQIATVKHAILYALLLLVPALALAGAGGAQLARGSRGPLIARKMRRMRAAGLNGLFVLVPAAIFLAQKAANGEFDPAFYAVQSVELAAGALNIALLLGNLRDGLEMSRRRVPAR